MKVRIGTLVMRCRACQGEQWRPADATAPLSLRSEVICLGCGTRSSCAELAPEPPVVSEATAEPAADAAQ
jgi:hypothetical protein